MARDAKALRSGLPQPQPEGVGAVAGPLQANNGDALVLAAVAGFGIVYQPAFLVDREIAAGLLVPLQLDHEPIALGGIFAVYPGARRPPAKVRAAIELFAEALADPGPV